MSEKKLSLNEMRIEKELKVIKRELEELRFKLERAERTPLDSLPAKEVKKVRMAAKEIKKSAKEVAQKAVRLVRTTDNGPYDDEDE